MSRRKLWGFPGGIHPEEHKERSNQTAIQAALIPTRLVLPLQQHIGAEAEPIVEIGETVLKGQKIATSQNYVSATLHAPTSGIVANIGPYPVQHPSGLDGLCIEITPDHKDQWIETKATPTFWEQEPSTLLDAIHGAGITGLGGAGFPARVKLNPTIETEISTLILNGVECEPYITADDRLMRERAEEIILGAYIMAYLVKPSEIVIAIEDNKPEAIAAMQSAMVELQDHPMQASPILNETTIEVVTIPTKYPSGGEKQLIQIITGKEVHSGSIPADIGVICQNVGTAEAIYEAIFHGKPLITRVTTFTGEGIYKPGNYRVMIGTPIEEMFDQIAAREHRIKRLIMGGPMMGYTVHTAQVPLVKSTNCIIAATNDEFPEPAIEQACIRCGDCASVCPAELLPQQLYWHSKSQNFDQAQHHNLFDCIECGACAYVCPSHIPLVQYYRYAKGEIRKIEHENQKADHSRLRFKARQSRIEKELAEKEAKRKARAEKAAAAQKAKAEKAAKLESVEKTSSTQPSKEAPNDSGQTDTNTSTANTTPTPKENADTSATETSSLLQLETAVNKAEKKWKDANRALQEKAKNEQNDLAPYQIKVDKLKTKLDKALSDLATAQNRQIDAKEAQNTVELDQISWADIDAQQLLSREQLENEELKQAKIKSLTIAAAEARVQAHKLQNQLSETLDKTNQENDEKWKAVVAQLTADLEKANKRSEKIEANLQRAKEHAAAVTPNPPPKDPHLKDNQQQPSETD